MSYLHIAARRMNIPTEVWEWEWVLQTVEWEWEWVWEWVVLVHTFGFGEVVPRLKYRFRKWECFVPYVKIARSSRVNDRIYLLHCCRVDVE
jgi:hypothetical protein